MLKFVSTLALLGATYAADPYHPAPYHPAPKPYHPAPAPYHPAPVHKAHHADPYKIPPRPFAYEYGVKDEYSGAYFDKKETQDEYGVVSGEYRVALPDGRTQIVTYHADHENGTELKKNSLCCVCFISVCVPVFSNMDGRCESCFVKGVRNV